MQLHLVTKWSGSGTGTCPSVYTTDDPALLVVQGTVLDAETRSRLVDHGDREDAVSIPAETILKAAEMIRARS